MRIRAGQLRHPIEIQENTETSDGDGGLTGSWDTVHTPWAAIRPATATEIFNASQLQSVITHVITTRFIAGLRTDYRILFESRIFNITSIADSEEHQFSQEIQAMEHQP